MQASGQPTQTPSQGQRGRSILFRTLAVLLGLSPFVLLELVLRLAGWGGPEVMDDPFVGFHEIRPLFVRQADRHVIPVTRHEFFRPESFAVEKAENEFRVFCLGGSTVQGRPFAIETSFTTWLELCLQAADPDRVWEVVNCGGVSYASYRLTPILRELLSHQADLFIIYTGHNEFLEARTYDYVKQTPAWIARAQAWLVNLRTYCVVRSAWLGLSGRTSPAPSSAAMLAAEVDALLDYRGALEDYHRDDVWRGDVITHFRYNLERMIAIARAAGVPVILCNPVANLKDCPPFKYEPGNQLDAEQRARFQAFWNAARQADAQQLPQRIELLQSAVELDPRHAAVHYHLAKCYEAMGRTAEAKAAFIRAKDEDICPLRILEPMHEVLFDVAARTRTPIVDIRQLFEELTPDGIPGKETMIDHVHPTISGHQHIARRLLEECVRLGIVEPRSQWEQHRSRLYQEQLESLDATYYAEAQRRLAGLRRWSQGRAYKVRSPKP